MFQQSNDTGNKEVGSSQASPSATDPGRVQIEVRGVCQVTRKQRRPVPRCHLDR